MKFRLFKWDVGLRIGTSYWGGGEPVPVKAGWEFDLRIDYNNRHKLQVNYDLTKILTEEMRNCWVCIGPLHKSVLDFDPDLQVLTARLKEKGLKGTFMRYGAIHHGH